jgi:hypothetical protein
MNKTSGIDPILIKKAYAKYDKIKKNKKKSDKGYYPSDSLANKYAEATTMDKGY